MLMLSLTPNDLNSAYQKLLVKLLSLSVTMDTGSPCNLKMLLMNAWSTVLLVKGWDRALKCEYLVNLSTITMITSFP